MKISGLDTFGRNVLFAKVVPESDEIFWQFVSIIMDKLAKSSPAIGMTNKLDLMPHMTLVKIHQHIYWPPAYANCYCDFCCPDRHELVEILRLNDRSRYLPWLLSTQDKDLVNMDFGVQPINNLQLCVIEAATRNDGFYKTLAEIEFKL